MLYLVNNSWGMHSWKPQGCVLDIQYISYDNTRNTHAHHASRGTTFRLGPLGMPNVKCTFTYNILVVCMYNLVLQGASHAYNVPSTLSQRNHTEYSGV